MALMQTWTTWVELIFPSACIGCARTGTSLCEHCCSPSPRRSDVAGVPVIAAGCYEGPLRSAVLAYKERERRDLTRPLARLLAHAAVEMSSAVLVPMASSRAACRRRGGNHVRRLARVVGRLHDRCVVDALSLTRGVRDSAGLTPYQRAANLRGAMTATPPSATRRAVILDDVLTTGASITEAVRALRHAGWTVAGAAVIARTELRYPARPGNSSACPSPGQSHPSGLAWA